ncbi:MAG: DMT family transporter [Gemmatimonadota bacterium]
MNSVTAQGNRVQAWTLLIVLSLIWGTSYLLIKKGLAGFDPLEIGLLRMSVAALCLTPFALFHLRQVRGKERLQLLVIGFTGNALPAFLYAKAETVIPSAAAGMLTSTTPIFMLIVGWLCFGSRFPLLKVLGILVGCVGTAVLALAGNTGPLLGPHLWYSLLVVLAAISYGVNANIIKAFFGRRDPLLVTSIAVAFVGWPSLVALLVGTDFIARLGTNPAAPRSLVAVIILGALGTAVAVTLFNRLLQISSIIFASSVNYTIPLVALGIGIFLDEALTRMHAVGLAVVLAGVWMANRRDRSLALALPEAPAAAQS